MGPKHAGRLFNFRMSTDIKLRITFEGVKNIPQLHLKVERSDNVFVLKVKIECALRLLQFRNDSMREVTAEEILLEYRGVSMRDMTAIEKYGLKDGAEIFGTLLVVKPARDLVVKDPKYLHLDELLIAEPGVPSSGMISRIISRRGPQCQVSWRQRWFRAEIMNVYTSSLLVQWLDWPEAEWPPFFVRVDLAFHAGTAPPDTDETWRVRWHTTLAVRELPMVVPRFSELPPMLWVKAFLRTYAVADEAQILRELHARLPPELLPGGGIAEHARHKVLVLGACGVGKSSLIRVFCEGLQPPGLAATADEADATARKPDVYWPTIGTKRHSTTVQPPGLTNLPLEIWDTSGQPRFKPLSLTFFAQANSLILVFDVKSRASFRELGAVDGWLRNFQRMTGKSPRNFPMILVGNKAESDANHNRQVLQDDVIEWLQFEGAMMPYIETSMVGDRRVAYRQAEHVFRSVARLAAQVRCLRSAQLQLCSCCRLGCCRLGCCRFSFR